MASVVPPSRAAPIIASQSSSDEASGFSTIAWAPARRAGIVTAAWAGCGVATTTAWTPAPTISSTLVKGFTPYCSAKARAFAASRPHTATNSDSGIEASASAWVCATLP